MITVPFGSIKHKTEYGFWPLAVKLAVGTWYDPLSGTIISMADFCCGYCGGPVDPDTGSCPACSGGNGGNTCTNVDPKCPGCGCGHGDLHKDDCSEVKQGAGETVAAIPFDGCDCGTEWTWSAYSKRYWCKECGKYKEESDE